jgi:hypothetical protein
VPYIPRLQSDETIFSLASRTHVVNGETHDTTTSTWLFDDGQAHRNLLCLSGLDHFERVVNSAMPSTAELVRRQCALMNRRSCWPNTIAYGWPRALRIGASAALADS